MNVQTDIATAEPDGSVRLTDVSPFLIALSAQMSVIGHPCSVDDLIYGQPVTANEFDVSDAQRALKRLDYVATLKQKRTLSETDFPVCAKLTDGSFVIIVGRDGEDYLLADVDAPEARLRASVADFQEFYAGEYLTVAPTVEALEAKHVGRNDRSHWFWQYVFAQRKLAAEILVATFVANALAVAVSLFSLQVYDRVIPNASLQTLWVLAVGAFVAIVFEALLRISRGHLVDGMGRQVDADLSAVLLSKLQGMRLGQRQMGPAALGSIMREFSSVREFFTATSMTSMADIPFVFIFLGLIYLIAGQVVWVIVAGMAMIILLGLLSRRTLSQISEDMQGANSVISRVLNEVTYGAEEIKLNRAENRFQSAWEELIVLVSDQTQRQRAASARLTFLSQGVQQTAYIGAVIVGVYMVLDGQFTVGAIIACSILTSRAIAPVTQLSAAISRWQQVRVALEGVEQIVNSEQERDMDRQYARKTTIRGDIEIRDLRFRYGEDQDEALNIPFLQIHAGETIAVLGRNGSGKSTLLKLLSALYDFEFGEVRIDGLEMRQIDPMDLRRNMGVLSQDVRLFAGTLRDNLVLGPTSFSDEQIFEALQFSGLSNMVERHPLGLDMPVADGGVGLSVGQRQSLGLSRVFLANPPLLLLDEPTAAMDQTLEKQVIQNLSAWLQNKTCILTTHRTEIIDLCDRIAVLDGGKIAMIGGRDDVVQKLRRR